MKFVKENLAVLISGAVALLILVFAFAPIPYAVPTLREELTTDMAKRYNQQRDLIRKWASLTLEIPGLPPAKGVPPELWVEAKINLINDINRYQREVETLARQFNAQGRLDTSSTPDRPVPLLPVPKTADLSRVGEAIPNFLPKHTTTSDPMAFRESYGLQFQRWRGLLALGQLSKLEVAGALPPTLEDLKTGYQDKLKKDVAGLAPGAVPGGAAANFEKDPAFLKYMHDQIINRASKLRMYIEDRAFQVRNWYDLDAPPDDSQIFEALVDSWFQADLVKAIAAINTNKAVAQNPVKRLTRVVVGNNARTLFAGLSVGAAGAGGGGGVANAPNEPGQLFFTSTSSSGGGLTGVPVVGPRVSDGNQGRGAATRAAKMILPDAANPTDFNLGMTGRAAGKTYDVVYMTVVLDVDPAYLFKFIDSLYHQNMCYTVTNMQMKTVDPLDRAAAGYIYGDVPVVEVEFLFECILFRSWTEPLMPDDIKRTLGGTAQG